MHDWTAYLLIALAGGVAMDLGFARGATHQPRPG
jgi:hypothetical protein